MSSIADEIIKDGNPDPLEQKSKVTPAWVGGLFGVFVFSVILYLPSLAGWAIWDDEQLLSLKATWGIDSLSTAFTHPLFGNYFRPLTSLSFVVENGFFHGIPVYYHLTNLGLHALTSVLVAVLGWQVSKNRLAGLLTGAFFAAQPIQVGATAWIGGRPDVLAAFFLALSLTCLLKYHDTRKLMWIAPSSFAFLLAGLAKEQSLLLLPAIAFSEFVFGKKSWKEAAKLCLPFAMVAIAYIGLWSLGRPSIHSTTSNFSDTMVMMVKTFSHYSWAFLLPSKEAIFSFTLGQQAGILGVPLGILTVGGVLLLLRTGWKSNRTLFWFGIGGISLYLPVSNFALFGTLLVAPYRCALVGLPVACILGILLSNALQQKQTLAMAVLALNLAIGTGITLYSVQHWITPLGFFQEVSQDDPHFIEGAQYYAHFLDLKGQSDKAAKVTSNVIAWVLNSDQWAELLDQQKQNALTPAVSRRLAESRTDFPTLGNFIGANAFSLVQSHQYSRAALVTRDALLLAPYDYWLNYIYGRLVLRTNRAEAIDHWETVLKLNPDYAECGLALGHQRLIDHNFQDANVLLEHALALLPGNGYAWLDLVDAKVGLHDLQGAKSALETAESKKLDPSNPEVQKRIAAITVLERNIAHPSR